MMLPCLCSSARYSSIVIVGSLQLSLNTSPCNLCLSDPRFVLGNIVKGRSTLPPPDISSLGLTLLGLLFRSSLHVLSSCSRALSLGSISGISSRDAGAEARISSSMLIEAIDAKVRVCRRRSSNNVVVRGIDESSEFTDVDEEGSEVRPRRLLLEVD
jgi:hypothetical protein